MSLINAIFNIKKELYQAPDDKAFWVNNGPMVKNLRDLLKAFKSMSPDQFNYHQDIETGKSHFADWIIEVLECTDCAKKIRKAENKTQAAEIIKKALKNYA